MSVKVSMVARKNPAVKDSPFKFYALAQADGEMNFRRLCKYASDGCTVKRADIAGVLYALIDAMIQGLTEGEIVRLGEFGSFQVSVNSSGVEKKEDFSASQVKGAHIVFRPGIDLVEMLKTLKFSKAATATLPKTDGKEEEEEGDGEDPTV